VASAAQGSRLTNYTIFYTNGTLTVGAASLGVTANNASRTFGATNPVFTGTITGIQNGENITATYATTATISSPVGTYPIVPSLVDPGNKLSNYTVTSSNGTLTVTAPPAASILSILCSAGNTNVTITWTSVSNLVYRVQYKTSLASTSWLNLAPDVTATGSTASFTDHPGTASQRFYRVVLLSTVTPLTPLVVVANDASRVYGATNPVFSGTISGVQSGDNITATYVTTATPSSPVGTYPITPSLVDPNGKLDKYLVSMTNGSLTVTAAVLTVAANDASRPYGASNPVFTGTITGIQNGENITATYATTATISSPAGTYPIVPTLVDPDNKLPNYAVMSIVSSPGNTNVTITWTSVSNIMYRVQYRTSLASTSWFNLAPDVTATGSTASFTDHPGAAPQRLYRVVLLTTVTPLTPLVVVADNASRVYGATNPVFSGTISGVQSGDNITATYATTATPSSPVGTYPITPSLVDPNGKLDKYLVSMTNGSLTISQANSDTVLTSSQNPSLYCSNVTFTVTVTPIGPATTTPTGSVQFYTNGLALGAPVVLSGGVAGLSATTLPVGTNTVGAAYLGDGNYLGSSNSLVQVVRPVVERPSTLGIQRNSGGTLTVTFLGTPGAEYVVQASSNLVPPVAWTNVSTNIAGTNGHWTFTDATANQPIRFYRAMAP
jgi:hypothetical protein